MQLTTRLLQRRENHTETVFCYKISLSSAACVNNFSSYTLNSEVTQVVLFHIETSDSAVLINGSHFTNVLSIQMIKMMRICDVSYDKYAKALSDIDEDDCLLF